MPAHTEPKDPWSRPWRPGWSVTADSPTVAIVSLRAVAGMAYAEAQSRPDAPPGKPRQGGAGEGERDRMNRRDWWPWPPPSCCWCQVRHPAWRSVRPPGPDAAAAPAPALPASPVDETKVPHYFGPYPNWANSPLTAPDATVTISAGGAAGDADHRRQPAHRPPVRERRHGRRRRFRHARPGHRPRRSSRRRCRPGRSRTSRPTPRTLPALASPGNTFNAYVLRPTGNAGRVRHRLRQRSADRPCRG